MIRVVPSWELIQELTKRLSKCEECKILIVRERKTILFSYHGGLNLKNLRVIEKKLFCFWKKENKSIFLITLHSLHSKNDCWFCSDDD